jgi:hypothetical protein
MNEWAESPAPFKTTYMNNEVACTGGEQYKTGKVDRGLRNGDLC